MGSSRIAFLVTVFTVLVLALSACSPKTPTTIMPANQVTILDRSYIPPTISVPLGTTVSWVNQDTVVHTVTSDEGLFNVSLPIGASFSYNTSEFPSNFRYHCEFHPEMTGLVIIE